MTREEAIDVFKHNYPSACFTDLCEAVEIAIQALSAQPERKKGKWIEYNATGKKQWMCSECCAEEKNPKVARFCYWCGADMRGKQE